MKKALGTVILLVASAGTLITPAMAADRNGHEVVVQQTVTRTTYVTGRDRDVRVREVRARNYRDRRDRDDRRVVYDRDWR